MIYAVHTLPYREVWAADFEFKPGGGDLLEVHCMVARELKTGRTIRLWRDELQAMDRPPFDIGPETLYIAFVAQAEYSCHLVLGWPLPVNTLDLFAEFRNIVNGHGYKCSLLGAMSFYGTPGIEQAHKDDMHVLAMRGAPFTSQERADLVAYCETDVVALDKLLPAMLPDIELPYALTRGRFTRAVAHMEYNGIPIDTDTLDRIQQHWPAIRTGLIKRTDEQYSVYEGTVFKGNRWLAYCSRQGIPWMTTDTGQPVKESGYFKSMAEIHPQLLPMYELRTTLEKLKQINFPVGCDGRNRASIWPFGAKTGRNCPKASEFIFGPARWVRSLIKPEPGVGLAYVDWSQQEFGIAAAFSRDRRMLEVYAGEDPYIEFAKLAGAVPLHATKDTHERERKQFKECMLGVNYGMGEEALAGKIGGHVLVARDLLYRHAQAFPTFTDWINRVPDHILVNGTYQTPFGWTGRPGREPRLRSLRNFPLQAAGADIMRLAACGIVEADIKLLAPVHDAFLIEAPLQDLDEAVAVTREIMAEAGAAALGGLQLKTGMADGDIIRYPDRFMDERGGPTWEKVINLLAAEEGKKKAV